MDEAGENPRGIAAVRVLSNRHDFDLQSLIDAAYDRHLPAFAMMIPPLVEAWDKAPAGPLKSKLAEPVAALRAWDHRWSTESVPMSLAVFWAEEMWARLGAEGAKRGMGPYESIARRTTPDVKLDALSVAVDRLAQDFGSWKTKWGEINRFQRLTGDIVQPFSDAAPSVPVGFTSSRWGSLAAFGAQRYPGTKRYYGTRGNSFVAVVEFGDKVRARAVSAGGESGDPKSPHFADQTELYAKGELREVYFYPEQLEGHAKRTYHPGE
jgi:acyl-homoserine-lactone acylase